MGPFGNAGADGLENLASSKSGNEEPEGPMFDGFLFRGIDYECSRTDYAANLAVLAQAVHDATDGWPGDLVQFRKLTLGGKSLSRFPLAIFELLVKFSVDFFVFQTGSRRTMVPIRRCGSSYQTATTPEYRLFGLIVHRLRSICK